MKYLKPHFYDKFICTAGDCPDTCCAGWQIIIDEESLERYGKEAGEFGRHLRNSIDWEKECFYQNNRRCAFLNEESLCDLYKALGPDSLCDTCKSYPRHTEEYEGLRELSLSLSCPEAAKINLSCKEPVRFLEEETDDPEDLNAWYYFDSNGRRIENEIDKKIDGSYYTFEEGKMQTFANTGIKTEVIDEIISFAKKHDIHCVILFGSRARGDFKRTSDIDIAASGGDFDRFALDVDEETSTLLEFDIVDLDRDKQDALRESIRREGKILFEKV